MHLCIKANIFMALILLHTYIYSLYEYQKFTIGINAIKNMRVVDLWKEEYYQYS